MKEQIISFDVAKLAKEKGFDIHTLHYYFEDSECRQNMMNETHGYYGDEYTVEYEELLENWNSNWLTKKNGDRCFGCSKANGYFETYSAPIQSLLQKWLREVYNIHLVIGCYNDEEPNYYVTIYAKVLWRDNEFGDATYTHFTSYEEALEKGLWKALNLITPLKN